MKSAAARKVLQVPQPGLTTPAWEPASPILVASDASFGNAKPSIGLARLFQIIKLAKDVDFSGYKPATVNRRIRRRMAATKTRTLSEYVRYISEHPDEIEALYQDLLITVTSFFRDPEAFTALTKIAFPVLFKDRCVKDAVRVWVPGCSTGEEAYSHAICLIEYMDEIGANVPLQIFGTDVNETAIKQARAGVFKKAIEDHVSPARLQRFFTRIEQGYKIDKSIRSLCIFATQNLLSDPPFSKMDIVSCRNLLIYLGPEMQRRVITALHYALKPGGYLMLGCSEAMVGNGAELFEVADAENRIYRKTFQSVQ